MNNKILTKMGLFGLCAASIMGCAGCGQPELVTFGQYSGTYQNNNYSVAATTWEKQENQEGVDGVWKLVGEVKYDENIGKALYYGAADTHYYTAITVKHADGITPENPTYQVDNRTLKPFDNGNPDTFTLIKSLSADSKDFVLTVNWNSETTVKYKFVLDKSAFTFQAKPAE